MRGGSMIFNPVRYGGGNAVKQTQVSWGSSDSVDAATVNGEFQDDLMSPAMIDAGTLILVNGASSSCPKLSGATYKGIALRGNTGRGYYYVYQVDA